MAAGKTNGKDVLSAINDIRYCLVEFAKKENLPCIYPIKDILRCNEKTGTYDIPATEKFIHNLVCGTLVNETVRVHIKSLHEGEKGAYKLVRVIKFGRTKEELDSANCPADSCGRGARKKRKKILLQTPNTRYSPNATRRKYARKTEQKFMTAEELDMENEKILKKRAAGASKFSAENIKHLKEYKEITDDECGSASSQEDDRLEEKTFGSDIERFNTDSSLPTLPGNVSKTLDTAADQSENFTQDSPSSEDQQEATTKVFDDENGDANGQEDDRLGENMFESDVERINMDELLPVFTGDVSEVSDKDAAEPQECTQDPQSSGNHVEATTEVVNEECERVSSDEDARLEKKTFASDMERSNTDDTLLVSNSDLSQVSYNNEVESKEYTRDSGINEARQETRTEAPLKKQIEQREACEQKKRSLPMVKEILKFKMEKCNGFIGSNFDLKDISNCVKNISTPEGRQLKPTRKRIDMKIGEERIDSMMSEYPKKQKTVNWKENENESTSTKSCKQSHNQGAERAKLKDSSSKTSQTLPPKKLNAPSCSYSEKNVTDKVQIVSQDGLEVLLLAATNLTGQIRTMIKESASIGAENKMQVLTSYPKPDEKTGRVHIAPNMTFNEKWFMESINAKSMKLRAKLLMNALWSRKERERLVLKRRKNCVVVNSREVTNNEIQGLITSCLAIQGLHLVQRDGVDKIETMRQWISEKLKADRYKSSQTQEKNRKKNTKRPPHPDKALPVEFADEENEEM